MNLNDLETFVLVAETGTFSEAGERLGVPKSTVSRRVARLEEELGIALLQRGARAIALSDDGRALAARCAPAIRELVEVERGLGDTASAPRGTLRVTTSIDFGGSNFFTTLVAAYALAFADVEVEVEVTNRVVDLFEEGFDIAFRSHTGDLQDRDDLVARRLTTLPMQLYASSAYLAERGDIERFADLAHHTILAHSASHRSTWPARPSVVVNDYGPLASMIAAGCGVGGLPEFVAAPYVARGVLVKLPVGHDVPTAKLTLVWLRSRHLAPRVRAFIDLAASHAAAAKWST